jgi:hypothetical protein
MHHSVVHRNGKKYGERAREVNSMTVYITGKLVAVRSTDRLTNEYQKEQVTFQLTQTNRNIYMTKSIPAIATLCLFYYSSLSLLTNVSAPRAIIRWVTNIEFIFREDFLPNGSVVLVFYNKLLQFFLFLLPIYWVKL